MTTLVFAPETVANALFDPDLAGGQFSADFLDVSSGGVFELALDAGVYTLTGAAAGLLADRVLNAEPGAYAVTGAAAALNREFVINAESGSYIITGAAAELLAGRVLNASPGSYVITGAAAGLLADRILSADAGSYTIVGFDATLTFIPAAGIFELNAEPGVYVVTGFMAELIPPGAPAISAPEMVGMLVDVGRLMNRS
jgi:hypothetical protein